MRPFRTRDIDKSFLKNETIGIRITSTSRSLYCSVLRKHHLYLLQRDEKKGGTNKRPHTEIVKKTSKILEIMR